MGHSVVTTVAPHCPAAPWTYSTDIQTFTWAYCYECSRNHVLFVVNKDRSILIYNKMSIYSHVETDSECLHKLFFSAITLVFECDT